MLHHPTFTGRRFRPDNNNGYTSKSSAANRTEEEAEEEMASKKRKYACKYKNEWKREFPFIQGSSKGTGYATCTLCRSDFSIEHGGRTDITTHQGSEKHKAAATQHRSQPSILGHLAKGRPDGVINAETKMAMLLATSNVPFNFADVFNKSVKDMFPDSEIGR